MGLLLQADLGLLRQAMASDPGSMTLDTSLAFSASVFPPKTGDTTGLSGLSEDERWQVTCSEPSECSKNICCLGGLQARPEIWGISENWDWPIITP